MPFSFEHLQSELRRGGVMAGLRFLGATAPHRYTGVYRLDGGFLANLALHDKLGEVAPADLMRVPLGDSFCQFVLRDGSFRSSDTGADGRLDGHPYQGVVMAYHGVPVLDARGDLWGTLCHFDFEKMDLADASFELLRKAAGLLPPYLKAAPA